jgi:hypothetical protein
MKVHLSGSQPPGELHPGNLRNRVELPEGCFCIAGHHAIAERAELRARGFGRGVALRASDLSTGVYRRLGPWQ